MDAAKHRAKQRRRQLASLLVLALALAACRERATVTHGPRSEAAKAADRATHDPPSAPEPAKIPEGIELVDALGLRERLQLEPNADPHAVPAVRGTLLNVWASWCGSCKREIPMLLELEKAFGPQGIDFVFLSADEPESLEAARAKMQQWGVYEPTLAIKKGSLGAVQRLLHPTWQGALPASFLFDEKGKRRYFWEGPMQEHELTPILQAFAAGTLQDGEWRPALSAGKTDR